MKQARALTITGGRLVTPAGVLSGPIRCVEGRIEAVGDGGARDGDQVVDAGGKLVAPGLVDFGVFAIDKPAFHFGGITRAALMPDQSPPLDHPARVRFAAASGKPDLWVHPLAAATIGLDGGQLAELALMREAGAKAVATGRRWIADSGMMHRLLQYAAMLDLVVVAHAEDAGLAGHAAATASEMATRLGLPSAPAEAEALAVDRQAVIAAIGDGTIDVVATGHDPRGPEDKRRPFADAEPGMAGAETLLAMVLTLVRDGVIAIERAFDLVARNPARLLGVTAGELAPGAEADIALVDPDKPWLVDSTRMAASAGNTPFDRQPVQGRVIGLWKGGVLVGD